MPYIHARCQGEIEFWKRRCKRCGKRWPFSALFALSPPKDMYYRVPPATSLARKVLPSPQEIASKLPKWPRWARILAVSSVLLILICLVILGIKL